MGFAAKKFEAATYFRHCHSQNQFSVLPLPIDINGGPLPLRYLKSDKADQSKTALPCIAPMSLGCTVGCPGAVGL